MNGTDAELNALIEVLAAIDPNVTLGEQAQRLLDAGYRKAEPIKARPRLLDDEGVSQAIVAAGFDLNTVIADSVIWEHGSGSFESLHAHGPWQPGTVYYPLPLVIRFETVEMVNDRPQVTAHEIHPTRPES